MESEHFEFFNSCISNDKNVQFNFGETEILNTENLISEFDMYIDSDTTNKPTTKDDFSMEDLDDLDSDFLLNVDPEKFEDEVLPDDYLDSVLDSINFYNEELEKQIPLDSIVNQPESENINLVTDVPVSAFKCDILSNSENGYKTDNLENIVPNWNAHADVDIDSFNITSENKTSEGEPTTMIHQTIHKSVSGLMTSKEPETSIASKPNKLLKFDSDPREKLSDLLNFKQPLTITNNNSVEELNKNIVKYNKNIAINNCATNVIVSKNNLRTLQLKNAKILDSKAIGLLSSNCRSTIPMKKLKDVNGLPSVVLMVKKSQVDELKSRNVLISKVQSRSLLKPKDWLSRDVEPVKVRQEISSMKMDEVVQTMFGNGKVNTDDNSNVTVTKTNSDKEKIQKSIELPYKIKKPKPINGELLFRFSAHSESPSSGTLNFLIFQKNDDMLKYYTGIPRFSYFMALLHCLKLPLNKVLAPFQMLLVTLMKLRLNLEWMDLAFQFGKDVQAVQEVFGITLYVLTKCLPQLVCWSVKDRNSKSCRSRKHTSLFVYGIKVNLAKEDDLKRIFICLSTNSHPIYFVSKAIPEKECTNGLDILDSSGIMNNLKAHDSVLFDKEIDSLPSEKGRSVLSVLSDTHDSFCTQPFVNVENKLGKMEKTVGEIQHYKFLYDTVTCGWADECGDQLKLFIDAVKVVCGIVNLCSVLPFKKTSSESIIHKRNALNLLVT